MKNYFPIARRFSLYGMDILSFMHTHSETVELKCFSKSKDGELITKTIKKLGYGVIRGSSSKGGAAAVLKIIDELKQKNIQIAITPDGPKGPAYRIKDGIAAIAQKSEIPVYPTVVTYAKPAIRLHSWDSFMIPLPFAKIEIKVFGPIKFSINDKREKIRFTIEQKMQIE